MKKAAPFTKAIPCLFIFLLLISCRKEISPVQALDSQAINRVHEWLDKQASEKYSQSRTYFYDQKQPGFYCSRM
ncbi:MAG: hypothetical protein ABW019_10620 [Chitinophagaceae bacterium]